MDVKQAISINKQIREARPSLSLVSPMSYWFVGLMGVFNLILGAALFVIFNQIDDPILSVVTKIIPAWVWGTLFFTLGVAKLATLYVNSWKWSRRTLLTGVALKSSWIVALIVRTFFVADNIVLTLCWVTIALTQIICYIYFLPPQEMHLFNGKRSHGRE